MKVLGLDNVLIAVGDRDAAARFYRDGLGLAVKFEFADAGVAGFAIGDEEPGLVVRSGPAQPPRFWLEVADTRAAAAELSAKGIEPLRPSFEVFTGWTVEYADPWGNIVGLTDYLKAPQRARRALPK